MATTSVAAGLKSTTFRCRDDLEIVRGPILGKLVCELPERGWIADEVGCGDGAVLSHAGDAEHWSVARARDQAGNDGVVLSVV